MKGINPLLYGLTDFYGTSGAFQGLGLGTGKAASLIAQANGGTGISAQAKGISELYTVVKAGRDRNALAGFNATVRSLFRDTGSTSLQGFVTFGLASVINGRREAFTELMGRVSTLNAQGSPGLGMSLVRQAVKTYEDRGTAMAAAFIEAAGDIMDRNSSSPSEMASLLGSFADTWSAVLGQTKASKDVPDLGTLAKKAGTLESGALKDYLAQVNAAVRKAGSSPA
ncbi:MAG TPA: hypothetical protein PKM41_11870 [Deltaproteobacteria bacterium]|nr:hypothetical protein [Deltaproteobacteria bacterium]HOI07823.1 hypothetical protein [Deltaproteobacteria bacterium]